MPNSSLREQLHFLIRDTKDYLQQNPTPYLHFEKKHLSLFPQPKPKKKPVAASILIQRETPTFSPPAALPKKQPSVAVSSPAPQEEKKTSQTPPCPKSLKLKKTTPQGIQKLPHDFFVHLEKMMPTLLPEIPLATAKPDDTEAKKIAQRWQYEMQAAEISILSSSKAKDEELFLKNLASALSITFAPCRVIDSVRLEKAQEWDAFLSASQLQIIIANDHEIWRFKNLMAHYKENPSQKTAYLGKVPLFMLPDLSLYFKDPQLKRSLWKALCQRMRNLDL